ncbi:MAG: helix-turn-helix domain-containing protein [Clostridia bacterium]|nr:helix-turn-helix domain-containing protein [Clostridia bacterium]
MLYRSQEGISQRQLAEMLNVSRQTIVRWEKNINQPSDIELKKIAALLCVSEEELLKNDSPRLTKDESSSSVEEIIDNISYGVLEQKQTLEEISAKQITVQDLDALKNSFDNSREQLEIQKKVLHQKKVRNRILIISVVVIIILLGLLILYIAFYADETHGSSVVRTIIED